jgi:hypothetical protein
MNRKIAIFAFNGEPMCFGHALLNLMDMRDRGYDAIMVIEGTATRQVVELNEGGKPFADIYAMARDSGAIDCVCQACSSKTGSLQSVMEQGLPLCKEMKGHPSVARYLEEGREVLIF